MVNPAAGNEGCHFTKSAMNAMIGTITRTMFIFFKRSNCRTVRIGVIGVFSFLSRFHLLYQYIAPCSRRNSKNRKDAQKEYSEYNWRFGYARWIRSLTKIKRMKEVNSPEYKYVNLFSNFFLTFAASPSHSFSLRSPLYSAHDANVILYMSR